MKQLVISKIIKSEFAVSPEDGNTVYEIIKKEIESKNQLELNFDGIDIMTTAFLNNAIGNLYRNFDRQQLNRYINMANISDCDLALVKKAIDRAKITFNNETKNSIREEFEDE